ncbi:F-box protein CPR1-like [Salvia divinorum]|uniref:F-box protein CPR1-like n=1 Tax=Salvia divinorum TaxID=28513 RepID=A0ABD1FPG4_SALDI
MDAVNDMELNVLRDTWKDEIVNWLMKEYKVKESWTIEYKFSTKYFDFGLHSPLELMVVYPIKLFKDGDVLMLLDEGLIYHSNKTRTTREVGIFKDPVAMDYITFVKIFTPRLFSLKSFGIENVISF